MAFGKPSATSFSSYNTCRCRLLSSRKSRSTIRTKPTPARTSVSATTEPSAPQPQTSARALPKWLWPSSPKGAKRAWRSYRDVGRWLIAYFIRCRGQNRRAAAGPNVAGRSYRDTRRLVVRLVVPQCQLGTNAASRGSTCKDLTRRFRPVSRHHCRNLETQTRREAFVLFRKMDHAAYRSTQ